MFSVILLLVVALVSLLIARVASVVLTVTGLPRPVARFQARSALTGAGFTTGESEGVVNHPVRRRVVMTLMLIGNLGLAASVAGILGGFVRADAASGLLRALLLTCGLVVVYAVSKSQWVDQRLSGLIAHMLHQHTDLRVRDHERLLHLSGEYSVKEVAVTPGSWMDGQSVGGMRLRDEGVMVLGVNRSGGTYVGVPARETMVHAGDTLIVYGSDAAVMNLGSRRAGAEGRRAHQAMKEENDEVRLAQQTQGSEASDHATRPAQRTPPPR